MTSGVYEIACEERVYYGSSKNVEARWKEHLRRLRLGVHPNPIMQNVWDKYGEEKFRFTLLEEVIDVNDLLTREQAFIDKRVDGCMNIAIVAGAPMRGRRMSEETKEKISKSSKGRVLSEETKRRMRKPKRLGHGARVAASLLGIKHSEERKEKNRKSQPGKRAVRGVEIASGREIAFPSLGAANRAGFDATNISRACDGKQRQYRGFIWSDDSTAE